MTRGSIYMYRLDLLIHYCYGGDYIVGFALNVPSNAKYTATTITKGERAVRLLSKWKTAYLIQ